MANVNAPNGFKPVRHLGGGVIRENAYPIASASATGLWSGDVVKLLTTGYIDKAATTDTTALIGIFAGCQYIASDGSVIFSPIWPAATVTQGSADATALVFDDPMIVYEVQCLTGTAFTLNMVGANADFNYAAGSSLTGRSASSLDVSSVLTTTKNFRIIRLIPRPENALGDSARIEVKFDQHMFTSLTGI